MHGTDQLLLRYLVRKNNQTRLISVDKLTHVGFSAVLEPKMSSWPLACYINFFQLRNGALRLLRVFFNDTVVVTATNFSGCSG